MYLKDAQTYFIP